MLEQAAKLSDEDCVAFLDAVLAHIRQMIQDDVPQELDARADAKFWGRGKKKRKNGTRGRRR